MQSDAQKNSVWSEALERKHESRNPPIRWILLAGGLVVFMMVGCLAIIGFMVGKLERKRPLDAVVTARGTVLAPNLEMLERFPSPNLQINPRDALAALRAREDATLNSYAWLERSNGIVRIPIERAMDLIAQRGLPTRASNAPPRTGKSSLELIRERSQAR